MTVWPFPHHVSLPISCIHGIFELFISVMKRGVNLELREKSTLFRVQRKSFLQLAFWASWSQHLLAQSSFQLAPKALWRAELISQFFCYSNSLKYITCPLGKIKTEFTSAIGKSTSPGLLDTTFFACCLLEVKNCEEPNRLLLTPHFPRKNNSS